MMLPYAGYDFFINLLVKRDIMLLHDEKALIQDFQKGNIKVFERIFSQYHKRIYSFCVHLHQSPDEAKETVQKVFVAIWEQRKQIDENKSIGSYIYSIARYIVYQEFRQQVYKKAAFDHILTLVDFNESTSDDVLYNELHSFIESALSELPKRQCEIFRLNRFMGLTYRQIAHKLSISENTVDTHIRRALKFLREKYKTYYNGC